MPKKQGVCCLYLYVDSVSSPACLRVYQSPGSTPAPKQVTFCRCRQRRMQGYCHQKGFEQRQIPSSENESATRTEIQLTPKATIFFAVFPFVPNPLQWLMQIFNEFVFLSLILVPAEIFFCTESNEVTAAFCFALFPSGINQCGLPSPSRQQE